MSIKLPKLFLDSGNPEDTIKAKGLIGHLEGQTTNPSLVVKHPEVTSYLEKGKKLTEKELLNFYKQIVEEIRKEIAGSISVEVYADWETKAEAMLKQAEEMNTWSRDLHIKFPTIPEGLKASHEFVKKNGRVNMTLVFDQLQAASIYSATLTDISDSTDSNRFQPHFVSPFLGRWDDRGYNGLDLLKNIIKMYKSFEKSPKGRSTSCRKSHVLTLAASIRNLDHLYGSIFLGADILTIPLKIIHEWVEAEKWVPDQHYQIDSHGLKSIQYENIGLKKTFADYPLIQEKGSLIDEGLKKFASDWKKLLV